MAKRKPILLAWMRAKRDKTLCAHRRTWDSRCRSYKVIESIGRFSEMGTWYFAITDNTILGRHRTRKVAEKTCEVHVSKQPLIIRYTNALHRHGVASRATKALRRDNKDDKVFWGRADILDKLMALKK